MLKLLGEHTELFFELQRKMAFVHVPHPLGYFPYVPPSFGQQHFGQIESLLPNVMIDGGMKQLFVALLQLQLVDAHLPGQLFDRGAHRFFVST